MTDKECADYLAEFIRYCGRIHDLWYEWCQVDGHDPEALIAPIGDETSPHENDEAGLKHASKPSNPNAE